MQMSELSPSLPGVFRTIMVDERLPRLMLEPELPEAVNYWNQTIDTK